MNATITVSAKHEAEAGHELDEVLVALQRMLDTLPIDQPAVAAIDATSTEIEVAEAWVAAAQGRAP